MARERGLTVDVVEFEKLMDEQRARARTAQKKEIITVSDENLQVEPTKFLGYDFLETDAVVASVAPAKKANEFDLIVDRTACYAEMGGQVGDTGIVHVPGPDWSELGRLQITNTQKKGDVSHSPRRAGLRPRFPRWARPFAWRWTRAPRRDPAPPHRHASAPLGVARSREQRRPRRRVPSSGRTS